MAGIGLDLCFQLMVDRVIGSFLESYPLFTSRFFIYVDIRCSTVIRILGKFLRVIANCQFLYLMSYERF